MPDTIGIEIRNLYKIFGPNAADLIQQVKDGMTKSELNARHRHVLGLNDINLSIAPGRIQVVMGLSGSGKSTLIRHINRLVEPTAGQIIIGGVDVVGMSAEALRDFRRHRTAMVFQKFALLPNRTVLENVEFGLQVQGVPVDQRHRSSRHWIERVGLGGFEAKYPHQLSGGMQQRVGLARALANDAPVLLMDEAYSALDPLIRVDMQNVLLDLQKEIRKTIVFITHDLDEALKLGDSIAILRDGELIQEGSRREIVQHPANDYVASFVREVNRSKVLTAEAVMAPSNVMIDGLAQISPAVTLEEVARKMSALKASRLLVVEDQTGRPVGSIGIHEVMSAMVAT